MTHSPVPSEQDLQAICKNVLEGRPTNYAEAKLLAGWVLSRLSPPPKAMEGRVQEIRKRHEHDDAEIQRLYINCPRAPRNKMHDDRAELLAMLTPGLVDRESEYSGDGMRRVTRPRMLSNSTATSKEKP